MLEAQRGHKRAEDAEQRLRQTQADAAQVAQLLAQAQQKQQVAEQQAQAAAGEIQDNQGHQCCSCSRWEENNWWEACILKARLLLQRTLRRRGRREQRRRRPSWLKWKGWPPESCRPGPLPFASCASSVKPLRQR